jgi:two-component system, OmpR family, sensor histidine kinase VicK
LGLALNPATAQIDEKARSFIQKAHESVQHLGRLFQDLLDISKAEDGRLSNSPKVVDVVAFTHDIVEGLQPKAQAKGLRMLFKPQPDAADDRAGERRLNPVYYANVDNDHLREVLSNLVENGIKYTPKGDVTVDIGGDAEHIVISVADSGIGIPKEDQAHLFQKFYRVDNTATREIGGTGLGLYLSRRLVETMGGRIWLESEFQRGSTFFVELPRISHEEATRLIESAALMGETAATPAISALHVVEPTQAMPAPSLSAIQTPPPVAPQPQPVVTYTNPQPSAYPQQPQPTANVPALEAAPQYAPQTSVQPPQPQYQQVQPLPQVQQQSAPAFNRATPAPRPNTPLNTIEQNPSLYTRPQAQTPVPPRSQNQP